MGHSSLANMSRLPLATVLLAIAALVASEEAFINTDQVVPEESTRSSPVELVAPKEINNRVSSRHQPPPFSASEHVARLVEATARTSSASVCGVGATCKFVVHIHSDSHETDNTGEEADKSMDMTMLLTVKRTGQSTYKVYGSDFKDKVQSTRPQENVGDIEASKMNNCLKWMELEVSESNGQFTAHMNLVSGSPIKQDDEGCAEDAQEFQQYVLGAFESLTAPTQAVAEANSAPSHHSGAQTAELVEFADVQHQATNKRTTHYRREVHDDGSVTVHRQYHFDFTQDATPAPFLLMTGDNSLTSQGQGTNQVDASGKVQSSSDVITSGVGRDSTNDLLCKDNPSKGSTCEKDEAAQNSFPASEARLEQKVITKITKVSEEELLQEELEPLDQFLQRHR